jgi:hypothetical protein
MLLIEILALQQWHEYHQLPQCSPVMKIT